MYCPSYALVTGLYLWRGFATALPGVHAVDTALAALKEAVRPNPLAHSFTFYLVEGISMLAERYLKSRYDKGREEERQRWLAWNQRREEALREGRDFTELPPGEAAKNHK